MALRPATPCSRAPGSACSRAASSAVRLEVWPPLVKLPSREREAHELGHPPQGLPVEQVGRPGGGRQVGVVGGPQRGAEHAHLQPAGADVGEEQRARGRDARVEDVDRVAERGLRIARLLRQAGPEAPDELRIGLRLGRPRVVERRPGGGQVRREIAQDGLAIGERRRRRALVTGNLSHGSPRYRPGARPPMPRGESQTTGSRLGPRNSQPVISAGCAGSSRRFGSRSKSMRSGIRCS